MLVISRRQGERIHIGDDIVITLVRIGPNSCRIGIEAPDDKLIIRNELIVEEPSDDKTEIER